ncbi:hypothetical protein RclHR1_03900013 [Rhizophagus clarus]|uniref:Actin-like ATPase domain-containing protein n=1 Tax=Rhizophagus clarus TaxID=94130 RepID=A0A2Z6RDE8_9GLOM|nr:hypothetical protein RclHR1_03900013 [Rhizophagus clarus]GES97331.1 hypothetical protein GLOIN_2v1678329 [Rhizophagus clarus]
MMSNNEDDNDRSDSLRKMMQDDDDSIRIINSLMQDDDDDDDDERIQIAGPIDDGISVVAAIDFGTTFSGFAHAYRDNPSKILVHRNWQDNIGYLKTPTVLKYEDSSKLISWGYTALAERPEKQKKNKKKKNKKKPINPKLAERFKLHLCKMEDKDKDKIRLPKGLTCKKAITDYLKEMGEVMKETLKDSVGLDFHKKVLIIMTVPAEFDNRSIGVMRECAYQAGLIDHKNSLHLKFTTEPEAAAINCMDLLKHLNVGVDESFIVVDCGGGTVDLTTRKLQADNKLSEKSKRRGGYCGGSFVDDEFITFLGRKVGQSAIKLLRNNHYSQLQYIIQEFCRRVKFPFTGKKEDFDLKQFNLDLDELCPVIKQYVKGPELVEMEEEEWTIELKFEDVKGMFDPVIKKILDLIEEHLNENNNASAMLLVGGFSESKYLREEVRKKFSSRLKVSFPESPATAIVEGAVQYGLNPNLIATRVLLWTYGTDVARRWIPGDPINRKIQGNERMGISDIIVEFSRFIKCGEEIPVNTAIPRIFTPGCIFQRFMGLDIHITDKEDAKFCDSPGVKPLGNWVIELPITFTPRPILFLLIFGEIEINAVAVNLETGRRHETIFKFETLPDKNCKLCNI